jgi:hypothetical protein
MFIRARVVVKQQHLTAANLHNEAPADDNHIMMI